jgi:hypothetical protein
MIIQRSIALVILLEHLPGHMRSEATRGRRVAITCSRWNRAHGMSLPQSGSLKWVSNSQGKRKTKRHRARLESRARL